MAEEVGLAYVRIIPSMRGFSQAASKEMSGALDAAADKAGKDAGTKFSGGFAAGSQKLGAGLTKTLTPAAAGIGLIFKQSFQEWDTGIDTIRAKTGATGAELEALGASLKRVGAQSVQPLSQIGAVMGDLATRTGLTGPPLEQLTKQLLNLERLGNLASAETVTRVFGDWGISALESSKKLDALFRASQATGPSVEALGQKLVQFGAPLRQLGFGFNEAAALIGKFEKEGVNTELVLGSMRVALGKMAREGEPAQQTFERVTKQIQAAGSASKANALALELFGARAGPDMAAAIREGRFEIGALFKEVRKGTETIETASADTLDWSDKLAMFRNRVQATLGPFGEIGMAAAGVAAGIGPAVSGVGKLGGAFSKQDGIMRRAAASVGRGASAVGSGVARMVTGIVTGTGRAIAATARWSASMVASAAKATASMLAAAARQAAAWAMLAARSMAAAARIAVAWLISMGPIAIVAAAVAGLVFVVVKNWDKIRSVITGAATAVVNFVKAKWPLLLAILTGPFGLAVLAIAKNWDKIVSTAKAIPGKIKDAFKGMDTLLVNTGKDLIQGFINGITSKIDAVKDTLGGLTKSLTDWKGPLAKDRKLLKPAGNAVIDGFVDGLEQRYPAVKSSLGGLTDQLKAKIESARSLAKEIQGAFTLDLSATQIGEDGAGDSLLKRMDAQAAQAEQFAATIKSLRKAGLRDDLLAQLVSQGPGSLAAAQELAANVGLANKMASRVAKAGKALSLSEVLAREGVNLKGGKVAAGGLFTDSQIGAIGAGGGAGSAPLNLIIQPVSDSKKFMAWLRYEIRAQTGGNVQKALGQGG